LGFVAAKIIEVLDTDTEGRVVLSDTLHPADSATVDLATLTGSTGFGLRLLLELLRSWK
jgi:leucyl aminopeptidase